MNPAKADGDFTLTNDDIAQISYETARAWSRVTGGERLPSWGSLSDREKRRAISDAERLRPPPEATLAEWHAARVAEMKADKWVYGEKKDTDRKVHPCLVPFEDLPRSEIVKIGLFIKLTRSLLL